MLLISGCSGEKEESAADNTETATELAGDDSQTGTIPDTVAVQAQDQDLMVGGNEFETGTTDERLIGTWRFSLDTLEFEVTYNADGTYESQTIKAGSHLTLTGSYSFDGTNLIAHPDSFATDQPTDSQAVEMVMLLNNRIEMDPQAAIERSIVRFQGENQFTQMGLGRRNMVFTRVE
jgi:hypothetical protein